MLRYVLALALAAQTFVHPARAEYPDRPIRIIVPWAAGGNVDIIGRGVAQALAEQLGQPVYVENQAGASGTVGAGNVARSAPDGHTLLFNSVVQTFIDALLPSVPYRPEQDFAPVGQVSAVPFLLVANPRTPFEDVPGFVRWAREQRQGVSYGSAGVGSTNHLAAALFASLSGLDLQHVPYRGSSLAVLDVSSGQIPILFDATTGVSAGIRGGLLKPIAMTSARRSSFYPDLPTFAESGYPDMVFSTWHGLFAPSGVPAPVLQRLSDALRQVTQAPEFRRRLEDAGAEVVFSRPAEFLAFSQAERARWTGIIRASGATASGNN
ncbi:tripartite tricarboxylate transporter substrate binding protein [Rhodovarius crocodyli]|uniref:Tripartite tricarboxylate transporter substrate binding protein n=1 Tax=Rhodovarius crocodyli TaxID=1979269 RepID=A0A437M1S2_9PROT|nr:tripartite tricarboxylate transporter substrate binding protein [Rhodovarius crocodyli]RVT91637.1 tripartite tricarboxylate transporter substrate binding protein [Rhodovarius crocodyli]